jgi:glycosyltransferase involved in cell wall biosynthesis
MKKIVFCLQTMVLGGVEKELITVLKKIHKDFDITLLLLYPEDLEILKEIPESVKIRFVNIDKTYYCSGTVSVVKQRLKKGKLFEACGIALKRLLRIGITGANVSLKAIPVFPESFDIAICYHIHSPLAVRYVVEKVRADKKIAWIHSAFFNSGYPVQRLKKYIVGYDEFVSVSRSVEREFRALCPWYRGGVSTTHNYLDADEIRELSKEPVDDPAYLREKDMRILTVGRFSDEKGIDLAIIASAYMKKMGLRFHWFVVGYGDLEETYRKLIAEHDVGDCFTLLGRKSNPYPYIKNCDVQVQPSRHEAYPLVLMEAKILKRPIVCANFDGADEQIENGVTGAIVPLNDPKAIAEELSRLIRFPEIRDGFVQELEKWSPEDDLKEIVRHFN